MKGREKLKRLKGMQEERRGNRGEEKADEGYICGNRYTRGGYRGWM